MIIGEYIHENYRGVGMYLKKIEIQGFKSFADKISLDFSSGITSIVGPNGSEIGRASCRERV